MSRSRKTEQSVNRRLLLTQQGASPSAVLDTLRRERGFSDVDSPFFKQVNDFWIQTGLRFDRNTFILATFALVVFFFLIFSMLFGFGFAALILAFPAAF